MAKDKSDEEGGKSAPKANVKLLVACLAAGVIIGVIVGIVVSSVISGTGSKAVLSKSEAGDMSLPVVKTILQRQGMDAELVNVEEDGNDLYIVNLTLIYGEQRGNASVYVTKDGKLLIPALPMIDLLETNASQATSTATATPTAAAGYPKSAKPDIKLFVMSFCPYGQQAETVLKPVADLLGDKIVMEPHFIVEVSGNAVSSLHGSNEAAEDMRQACIIKYAKDKWWKYVSYVDSNCNLNTIDTCWEQAADNAGIDKSNITACYNNEGLTLMSAENAVMTQYGVSSSPTVFINDKYYSGNRTSSAFEEAICSAFSSPPAECSQTLGSASTTATAPAGGCAPT